MKGLNLKTMKKIATDGKYTTFKHDDGHEIKIAHTKLSKPMQKEMAALPHFDNGGVSEIDPEAQAASDAALNISPKTQSAINAMPKAPENTTQPINEDIGPEAQNELMDQSAGPSPASSSTPGAPTANPYNAYGAGAMEERQNIEQGMKGFGEAEKQEADTVSRAGNVGASETLAYDKILRDKNAADQEARQEVLERRKEVIDHYKSGALNPHHYWESKSTGSKISTAIGLILGGMGSKGGQNLAADFINKQIDRDMDAQKSRLGIDENLLSANFREFGDLKTAQDMTKQNLADIYSTQIQRLAQQTAGPMAQARAAKLISELQMSKAPELGNTTQKVAMGKIMQNLLKSGDVPNTIQAMRMFDPAMAKSLEQRYVPGVNAVASIPVPEETKKEITVRQDFDQKIGQLREFAKQNSGSLNPAIMHKGAAMAKIVQDAARQAANQGVFKESENKFMNSIISDNPTAFFGKYRTDPGYAQIEQSNRNMLNNVYKNYGLPSVPEVKEAPAPQGSLEGKTASDGNGNKIIMKNGKWIPYGRK